MLDYTNGDVANASMSTVIVNVQNLECYWFDSASMFYGLDNDSIITNSTSEYFDYVWNHR